LVSGRLKSLTDTKRGRSVTESAFKGVVEVSWRDGGGHLGATAVFREAEFRLGRGEIDNVVVNSLASLLAAVY
jgi:hypothetical protein